MSGRSPYFGALLWLGYVASDFWLFVAAQALVALVLLRLAWRLFGLDGRALPGAVALLAGLTSLPFYDAMLMPDALAGFGLLAFLLLAIERGRASRAERALLSAVMLVSAISHLTHILMLAGMLAVLLAARLRWPRLDMGKALPIGGAVAVLALASVMLTSAVVARVFDRPPQLVPLLTSRILEDGPGRAFIRAGCDGGRFAVCGVPAALSADAPDFLWSRKAGSGVFLLVDPGTRARLSAEDTRFFLAVARAYPLATAAATIRNSARQMADFRNGGLDGSVLAMDALPAAERARFARSLAGRGDWPEGLLDAVHYLTVLAALAVLAVVLVRIGRRPMPGGADVALCVALFLAAMVVNDVLGGGVSIPQYRYQARIIWLVPFLALVAAALLRRHAHPARRPAVAA